MGVYLAKSVAALAIYLIISVGAASASSASSQVLENVSPYIVLKTAGTNLFSRISANQQAIQKFPLLMRDIIEEELMPSIDYRYASYRILGKHLKKISKQQRAEFVKAMRHYLVRTYSIALAKYKNQKVIFEADQTDKK